MILNKTVWVVLNSRAVVPVKVETIEKHTADGYLHAISPSGKHIFESKAFATKEEAIRKALSLIERSELQAKAMLLNAEKHRLYLQQSIKEHPAA